MNNLLLYGVMGFGKPPPRRYPEFNPAVAEADFSGHGEVLCTAFEWLDLVARLHKLTSLHTFCDQRPIPGGIMKWLNQLQTGPAELGWAKLKAAMDQAHGPRSDWHGAAQGIAAVEALLTILKRDGWQTATAAARKEFPEMGKGRMVPVAASKVVKELAALAACLRTTQKHGAQFRLTMSSPLPIDL